MTFTLSHHLRNDPKSHLAIAGSVAVVVVGLALKGRLADPVSADEAPVATLLVATVQAPFRDAAVNSPASNRSTLDSTRERLRQRDVGEALHVVERSIASGSDLTQAHLVASDCYLLYRSRTQAEASLTKARMLGASPSDLEVRNLLVLAQAGELEGSPAEQLKRLVEAGGEREDALLATAWGCLATGRVDEADKLISSYEVSGSGESVALSGTSGQGDLWYLRGAVAMMRADYETAERHLREALAMNSRHELAHIALVDLLESPTGSLAKALTETQQLAERFPHSSQNRFRLARLLRKTGSTVDARRALGGREAVTSGGEQWWLEKSELDFDEAHYTDSVSALSQLGLLKPSDYGQMLNYASAAMMKQRASIGDPLFKRASLGGLALAYAGERENAEEVFDELLKHVARLRRIIDLNNRLAAQGSRPEVAAEMSELSSFSDNISALNSPSSAKPLSNRSNTEGVSEDALEGSIVYARHCAHCHGERGDGKGKAARHLFPLPRNFRAQRLHFVSLKSGYASDTDIAEAIHRGLPGTSMPAYPNLSDSELKQLIAVIRNFQREGIRARLSALGKSEQEIREQTAKVVSSPALVASVPPPPTDIAGAFARGRKLMERAACQQCHLLERVGARPNGPSASYPVLFDEAGEPTSPTNWTRQPLKGGNELTQIYMRLANGIPGTPHPALEASPLETLELALFIQSSATKGSHQVTNAERRERLPRAAR